MPKHLPRKTNFYVLKRFPRADKPSGYIFTHTHTNAHVHTYILIYILQYSRIAWLPGKCIVACLIELGVGVRNVLYN